MTGHVAGHAGVEREVVMGEDKTIVERLIETKMILMREPDEVRNMVVGSDAVEVVALEEFAILIHTSRSSPR